MTPLLELRGISKTFPGVKALDDVSFALYAGEVHMLLGENGAGKSSLMKVLCGAYQADAGEFFYKGDKVTIASTADAQKLGIAVIFQEFSLVPYLDIAQNIFLGREPKGRIPGTIDRRKILADAKRLLDTIGFDIDPSVVVNTLGVAQQQMVEIAKAISQNARILVMDEPTAALSDRETELLFALIARLKADGVSIVYISHRMAEVFALGDRITVLRDGRRIDGVRPADVTPDQLVRMMVGRTVDMTYPRNFADKPGEVLLAGQGPDRAERNLRHQHRGAPRRDRRPLRPGRIRPQRGGARDLRRRSGRLRRDRVRRQADLRRARRRRPPRHRADPREPQERRASRCCVRSATISSSRRCENCFRAGCSIRAAASAPPTA